MKTEEIVRSLRWCGTGTEEGCGDCAFEPQCDEDAVGCVGGLCDAAADKIEELVDRCARYAEEIAVLRERGKRAVEDASPYAAATERQAVGGGVPDAPDGVMLDMSDPERPELMKRLHFAVAYVRCGIVFHQPYKIFSENVAAGHIRPVSSSAEKMLGEEI